MTTFPIVEWRSVPRTLAAGLIGGVLAGVWPAPEYCGIVRFSGGFCQQPGRDIDHDHHDQQSPPAYVRSTVMGSTVSSITGGGSTVR